MKKIKLNKILPFFMLVAILLVGCETYNDDLATTHEGTNTEKMAGEWYVTVLENGANPYGYIKIMTFNTADNSSDEMFVDDLEHFWDMKGKVSVNYDQLTFSGTNITNEYYASTFDITDGKILLGAATSTDGNVTDSIYFNVVYSDGGSDVYTFAGYRRTGFLEDEH